MSGVQVSQDAPYHHSIMVSAEDSYPSDFCSIQNGGNYGIHRIMVITSVCGTENSGSIPLGYPMPELPNW